MAKTKAKPKPRVTKRTKGVPKAAGHGQSSAKSKSESRPKTAKAKSSPGRATRGKDRAFSGGMWSGTISFGLVSVPVSLFPALRRQAISLRMLAEDGVPLRRQYVSSVNGKVLEQDDVVRGYETEGGKMITVSDGELEGLVPEKSSDIDLIEFVLIKDIDVFHFDRPYFLVPGKGALKAYALLAKVMEEHERAGIGTFVMREKEYLVAILAREGLLMAETLRFANEIRTPQEVGLGAQKKGESKRVKQFEKSIAGLGREDLDMKELEDRYTKRMQSLIGKRSKSARAVVQVEMDEEEPGNVIDLVSVFKERMREAQKAETDGGEALEQLSKDELYNRAQVERIPGRSRMSKAELAKALSA